MAEQNYSIERDLKEARAMAEALIPYVYRDELYQTLGGSLPSLTLGALLMRLRRLRLQQNRMTKAQLELFRQVEDKHEAARAEWQTHYTTKMLREAESRLNNLNTYFKECDDDPRLCANAYMPEALRRTIVQEILDEAPADAVREAGLILKSQKTDARMRRYVRPCGFIWDQALEPVYPETVFWWLYNRPPQPDEDDNGSSHDEDI